MDVLQHAAWKRSMMKTEMKDSAGVRIPPPVFFFICLGAGLWLESVFPDTAKRMPLMFRLIPGLVLTVLSWLSGPCSGTKPLSIPWHRRSG